MDLDGHFATGDAAIGPAFGQKTPHGPLRLGRLLAAGVDEFRKVELRGLVRAGSRNVCRGENVRGGGQQGEQNGYLLGLIWISPTNIG